MPANTQGRARTGFQYWQGHNRPIRRNWRRCSQLPGGLVALYDGRGRNETTLWLPEQRALVFADALTPRKARGAFGLRRRMSSERCQRCAPCLSFRSRT